MRPLSLTVAGLHSYRDPVTIDFEELGRYGLFGVFGPIGAGKSTLLDAITLALYGLVDRVVGRSRRGLVHAQDPTVRCEVRFRFAVGSGRGGDPHRTFEVHRAYRDEAGVAQRVGSRLVELVPGGPPVALAEKETEINARLEELVGLSAEDFLRAVVLPQGRFVQLLQLKGQERRQMLQRIFRLQAYGEDLRARVRERQGAARSRQAEVRGELAGLGDASPATVATAVRVARSAREAREAAELEHHDLAARVEEGARRRERRDRWRAVVGALEAHAADAPRMAAAAASLARAAALLPLAPLLDRRDRAAERSGVAGAAAEAATRDRAARTAAHARTAAAADAAQERERTEGAVRRAAVARLEELERQRAEAEALREALRGWERAAETGAADERSAREEADRLRVRVAELDRERRKVRRELTRVRVEPAERERVLRAARAADAVAAARRLAEEARADELAAAGAALVARQRVAEAEEGLAAAAAAHQALEVAAGDPVPDPEPWVRRVEELRSLRERRSEREVEVEAARADHEAAAARAAAAEDALAGAEREVRSASQVLRGAETALADAEVAFAAHQQRSAAWALSRRLGPGVPCEVCGSAHHPAPAGPPDGDPAPAVEAHRLGRQRAAERRERAREARAAAGSVRDAAAAATEAARERWDRARSALAALPEDAASPEAERALAAVRERLRLAEAQRARAEQASREVERARIPVAGARATLAAAEAEAVRATELRRVRSAGEGAAWAAFDADRGELTLFDVGSAVARLEARDREAHAAAERAESLDHDREAAARRAEDERTRAERAAAATARSRERAEVARARLAELGGGEGEPVDPALALRAERAALDDLERTAAASAAAARTSLAELSAAAEAHAAAVAAARTAAEELARAEAELAPLLAQVAPDPLDTLRAELAALPDAAARETVREAVEAWRRQGEVLRGQRAALEAEGADGAPDDATWAAWKAALEGSAQRLEEARDGAVLAARAAEELAGRAARWQVLVGWSDALDAEVSRLDELAQLLRGDRFVEYVANDHLQELTLRAGEHLAALTGGRYRLSLDEDLSFVVRDADLGGVVRPVTGLSGGESFLTALALALALSSLVQARSARPLGFFFLDEGFGTLDPDALDRVMSAIEQLRAPERLIGVISHVPEVRDRVPRYLAVSRGTGGASEVRVVDA